MELPPNTPLAPIQVISVFTGKPLGIDHPGPPPSFQFVCSGLPVNIWNPDESGIHTLSDYLYISSKEDEIIVSTDPNDKRLWTASPVTGQDAYIIVPNDDTTKRWTVSTLDCEYPAVELKSAMVPIPSTQLFRFVPVKE